MLHYVLAHFPLRNYARRQKHSESRQEGNGEIDPFETWLCWRYIYSARRAWTPEMMPKGLMGVSPPPRPKGTPAPKRKRQNAAQKRERKAAALQLFIKQVGRKAQHGAEPNDRHSNEKARDRFDRFGRKTLIASSATERTTDAQRTALSRRQTVTSSQSFIPQDLGGSSHIWRSA